MPTRRIGMPVMEEVLRLRHKYGGSQQAIARECELSVGAVNQVRRGLAVVG